MKMQMNLRLMLQDIIEFQHLFLFAKMANELKSKEQLLLTFTRAELCNPVFYMEIVGLQRYIHTDCKMLVLNP